MTELTPAAADKFFRRFHHGRGGRLTGYRAKLKPTGVTRLSLRLKLLDGRASDVATAVRLELLDVTELRWQIRPTERPAVLTRGIHVGYFQNQFFIDLQPWDPEFEGPHDFRVSSCYAAGLRLRAAVIGEDAA